MPAACRQIELSSNGDQLVVGVGSGPGLEGIPGETKSHEIAAGLMQLLPDSIIPGKTVVMADNGQQNTLRTEIDAVEKTFAS